MTQIFISYARADGSANAERLENALQSQGFATWRDTRGIDPAKDFTAEIERAIRASDVLITCITPDTERDDSFVRREIQYALIIKKPVIVARFTNTPPPIHVVNNTWVEFWKDWAASFEHLNTVLNTSVENYEPPVIPTTVHDPLRSYVEMLYQRTVDFLDQTVIRLIDLTTEETLDAAITSSSPQNMIDLFFSAHGIANTKSTKRASFNVFTEAFNAFNGRVLLLGEPGAGKSITLMAFARDIAAKRLTDSHASLPLLGLISSWPSNPSMQFDDWLVLGMANEDAKAIKEIISLGKAILLLDGLDELPQRHEKSINANSSQKVLIKANIITEDETNKRALIQSNAQRSFMELLPSNNQLLVTCRVKDYEAIGQKIALNGAVTIRQLDDRQMQMYLAEQPELWEAVQADEKLKEMLTTPLLLSFFAFAYRDELDGSERRQLVNFSNGPADLRDKIFETYIRKRYEHEERKYKLRREAVPFMLDEIYDLVGQISTWSALYDSGSEDLEGKIDLFKLKYPLTKKRLSKLNDFLVKLHVLSPPGVIFKDEEYLYADFKHLLLRDYFAFHHASQIIIRRNQAARNHALWVLTHIGDKRIIPQLLSLLGDVHIGEHVAMCLLELNVSAKVVAPSLQNKNPEVRYNAAIFFGEAADFDAVPPLLDAFKQEKISDVRWAIADAICSFIDDDLLDFVIDLAFNDAQPDVQNIAAFELSGRLYLWPRAFIKLAEALLDFNEEEWKIAYTILHKTIKPYERVNKEAVQLLCQYLESTDIEVKTYATYVAGIFKINETIDYLKMILTDSSETCLLEHDSGEIVKFDRLAADALEKISTPEAIDAAEKWRNR